MDTLGGIISLYNPPVRLRIVKGGVYNAKPNRRLLQKDITFLQYDLPVGSRRSGGYVNRKLLHDIYCVSRPPGWP